MSTRGKLRRKQESFSGWLCVELRSLSWQLGKRRTWCVLQGEEKRRAKEEEARELARLAEEQERLNAKFAEEKAAEKLKKAQEAGVSTLLQLASCIG